ncbi:MAG: ribbon-helix-helix protein, CopG family [Spirochaetales bacterium]|nr:ribbon-helix-helix protein, CopG family [Spirochaetales bacterium]
MGRPTTDPHTHGFLIKFTESDRQLLDELASKQNTSKSDILRTALREYGDKLK